MTQSIANFFFIAVISLLVCFVFGGVSEINSLRFDDSNHLVRSLPMQVEQWRGILYFWTHSTVGAFAPLTNSVWFSLKKIGVGLKGFYLCNLIVYLFSVYAAYFALQPFIRSRFSRGLATLWFALHPLHVEPVAWITCLRDILAGLFSLLAIGAYTRFLKGESTRFWYLLSFISFLCAVLSKNTAFVLPLVLAAIGWGFFHRPLRKIIQDFFPWSLTLPLLFYYAELHAPIAQALVAPVGWSARLLVALDAVCFYFSKSLLPINLIFDYGRAPETILSEGLIFVTPLIPLLIAGLLFLQRKAQWARLGLMIYAIFVGAALMALGFQPFVFQHISTVADRYIFLSLFAPALALGLLASKFRLVKGVMIVSCLGFAFLSHRQVSLWKDEGALYQRMVELNPESWFGYQQLGLYFERAGQIEDAIFSYKQGIKKMTERRKRSVLCLRLGSLYLEQARYPQAIGVYTEALSLDPYSQVAQEGLKLSWTRLEKMRVL